VPPSLERVEPLQQPTKFARSKLQDLAFRLRPNEPVFFQPFLPETKAVALPVEDLQDGPPPVAEDEEVAGEDVALEMINP
jgi:hypothetical protein